MNSENDLKVVFQNHFLKIRDKFKFQEQAAFVLVTFQQFQILSFIISEELIQELSLEGSSFLEFLIGALQYFRIYVLSIWDQECNQGVLIIVLFCYTLILILALLLIIRHRGDPQVQQSSQIIQILDSIISITMKFYFFVFHWTLTYCIFKLLYIGGQTRLNFGGCAVTGFFVSIPTLVLSIILIAFVLIYSFTYHFKKIDCLYGEDTKIKYYQVLAIYCQLISNVFLNSEAVLWIGLLTTLSNILIHNLYVQFRSPFINKLYYYLQGQMTALILLVILINYCHIYIQSFTLLCFFICPLVFVIQIKCMERSQRKIYLLSNNNISEKHIDKVLRAVYAGKSKFKQQLFGNPQQKVLNQLQLHCIAANHLSHCKLEWTYQSYRQIYHKKQCFCLTYFPSQILKEKKSWNKYIRQSTVDSNFTSDKDDFTDEAEFKRFIYDFIKQQYQENLDSKSKNLYFSYITFLFEVLNQPTKAFYEAIRLKLTTTGFKNKVIIEDLITKSRDKFNTLILKEKLENQKYDVMSVIRFDQSIQQAKLDILNLIIQYRKWYQIIDSQVVNFNQMKILGTQILKEIKQIEINIHTMFTSNPSSSALTQIIKIFYKFIHFNEKKPEFLKKNEVDLYKFHHSLLRELYDPDSFVIQITLMQPRGTILNYTRQLKKLTGLQDKDIQNQNIKMIIPDIIAQYHDQYLDTFVETGRMNVVKADNRILYMKNKDMFIFPITAKVRIENYSNNDFGASALLHKINTQYYYLLLNNYGMLEECCENIFNQVLKKSLKMHPQQLKGLDFLKIMPYLYTIWEQLTISEDEEQVMDQQESILNDIHDDYIVIPKDQAEIQNLFENQKNKRRVRLKNYLKIQRNQILQYLQNFSGEILIYEIKYKIRIICAINQNIIVLEIQYIRLVKQKSKDVVMKRILRMIDVDSGVNANISTSKHDEQDYFDLDQNFIMEDDIMIKTKQSNLDVYLKQSSTYQIRQDTNINSIARQHSDINQSLLPLSSHTILQLTNMDNCYQIDQLNQVHEVHEAHSKEKSQSMEDESNSKSIKRKDQDLQMDTSSISSARNNDDLKARKQIINDVLNSNESDHSNLINKIIFLFIFTLAICYSFNLGYIFYDKNDFEINLSFYNSTYQVDMSLKKYIIANDNATLQRDYIASYKENMENLQFTKIISLKFTPDKEDYQFEGFYTLKTLLFLMIQNNSNFYSFITENYNPITEGFRDLIQSHKIQLSDEEHSNQSRYKIILIVTEVILGIAMLITLPIYMFLEQQKLKILKFFIRLERQSIAKTQDMFQLVYDQLRFQQSQTIEYNTEMLNIKSLTKTLKNQSFMEQGKIKAIKTKSYTHESNSYMILSIGLIIVLFFASLSAYLIISYVFKEVMINDIDEIQLRINEIVTINHYLQENQAFVSLLQAQPQQMYDTYYPFNIAAQKGQNEISELSQSSFTQDITNILEQDACLNFQNQIDLQNECIEQELNQGLIQIVISLQNQQDILISQIIGADSYEKFYELIRHTSVSESQSLKKSILIISVIMNDLSINLSKQTINKFQNQIILEIIIFVLGITFILFFTLIIQRFFRQLLIRQIGECENLLRLIPYDMICQNAYIMSYITQKARSIKQ